MRALKRHGRKLAEYPGVVVGEARLSFSPGKADQGTAIRVCVLEKVPEKQISQRARLPKKVEGVPVDVRVASLGDQVDAWEVSGASDTTREAGLTVRRMATNRGVVMMRSPLEERTDTVALRAWGGSTWVPYRPPATPLAIVEEQMKLILNSGPDSGWETALEIFCADAQTHHCHDV
jgi:hypothetical protein